MKKNARRIKPSYAQLEMENAILKDALKDAKEFRVYLADYIQWLHGYTRNLMDYAFRDTSKPPTA